MVDVTQVITDSIYWFMYPILNWSFSFSGITMTMSDFLLGCAIFGIVILVLKAFAGDALSKLKFINLLGGE